MDSKKEYIRNYKIFFLVSGFFLFTLSPALIYALPYTTKLDISSIEGSDFELEFSLYDNNGIIGDSYVLIDNIFIDDGMSQINFEANTLEGFSDFYDPDYINIISGNITTGDYILRLDEDPLYTPTITFRDFTGSTTANFLFFDFEFISSGSSGLMGQDSFVASLLNPENLAPLIPGLTPGFGDFLEVRYNIEAGLEIDTLPQTEIIDINPPEIICPDNITVSATGELTVVYYEVTVIDDMDPNPAISSELPSGSGFPIGETIVTVTATDASGNSSDCSFIVTVTSTINIELDLPAGWSMISLPVKPDSALLSSLFPEAIVIYYYERGTGYIRVKRGEDLKVGRGNWILLNKKQKFTLTGQLIQYYTRTTYKGGWEMIGGCTYPAKASVDNGNIIVIYSYVQGTGYKLVQESENLEHGKGYWICISEAAQIRVNSEGFSQQALEISK